MNETFRKVALVAASLGLVVSLFVALRQDDGEPAATTAPAATVETTTAETETGSVETEVQTGPQVEPPATTQPPPVSTHAEEERVTIRIAVAGGRPEGGIRRASVRKGREVVLRVTSDVADHVHLHGYDLFADVAPGAPAELRFVADVPGRFEVELEDRGVQIADLEVRP